MQKEEKQNEFSLFLASKHYLNIIAVSQPNEKDENSWITLKDDEKLYVERIMSVGDDVARQHIMKQASMPASSL